MDREIITRDVMSVMRLRRDLSAFVIMLLVGVLHRAAETTPWADDRLLAADPAWVQFSAPKWHSILEDSSSIDNALTRLVDPLSQASTAGDARAIGAVLAAFAALALLLIWRRLAIPDLVAFPLCFSVVAPVLPTPSQTALAQAIQMLAAAAMLLAWGAIGDHTRRVPVLAALTVIGALNHFGFVAFTFGIWIAEFTFARRPSRILTLTIGSVSLVTAVVVSAVMMRTPSIQSLSPSPQFAEPAIGELAMGLVTGRFGSELQPDAHGALGEAAVRCIPAPLIVSVPLAALAFADRRTRRLAAGFTLSAVCVVFFMATTWVPDLAIAMGAARIALVTLIALGLSWLWREGPRGSQALGVVCACLIAITPFMTRATGAARVATAEMESFAASASSFVGDAFWSADRLSTVRALLARHSAALAAHHVEANAQGFARAPRDARFIAFSGLSRQRIAPDLWIIPHELPHSNAATFVAALPNTRWLAIALRGSAAEGFCRALLTEAGIASETTPDQLAAVVHPHGRELIVTQGGLDVPYGGEEGIWGFPSPAHFSIATEPAAQITVNSRGPGPIVDGMMLATFDTDTLLVRAWTVGPCSKPNVPPIEDRRLRATYVLEANGMTTFPAVPVVSNDPVEVPLGEAGEPWFAAGWNTAEAPGAQMLRWTAATSANVHVVVSHQQSLRVQLTATLAERQAGRNSLTVLWNGTTIAPPASGAINAVWTVPSAIVRRGVNVLTFQVAALVSPADLGMSSDRRLLGAAIRHLSIVPIGSSTAANSPTGPR